MVTLQVTYKCVAQRFIARHVSARRDVRSHCTIHTSPRAHCASSVSQTTTGRAGRANLAAADDAQVASRSGRRPAMDKRRLQRYRLGYETYSPRHPLSPSAPRRSELCARALGSRVLLSLHTQTKVQLVHIRLSLTRRGRNTRDTSAHVSTCSCLIRQAPTCHIRQVRNLPY